MTALVAMYDGFCCKRYSMLFYHQMDCFQNKVANVNHFFTLLGKMFFTPYGKEFFT